MFKIKQTHQLPDTPQTGIIYNLISTKNGVMVLIKLDNGDMLTAQLNANSEPTIGDRIQLNATATPYNHPLSA